VEGKRDRVYVFLSIITLSSSSSNLPFACLLLLAHCILYFSASSCSFSASNLLLHTPESDSLDTYSVYQQERNDGHGIARIEIHIGRWPPKQNSHRLSIMK
jgi:hypothetical protein